MSKPDEVDELKVTTIEDHLSNRFPDEIQNLLEINRKLEKALTEADGTVGRADKDYMDMKRYMAQYRGELDPHEMFQNELALRQLNSTGAFVTGMREKLVKLLDSPYFGRIDFKAEGEEEAEKQYIGRFTFSDADELLIVDWRAPIAGLFYDYEVGPGGYDAPAGRVEGELTRKRQYKIKNGILEYALESSLNIQDDILQKELSRTSNEKMKSIIGTIQREQNRIIRNEEFGTLVIQGVAGSGKTSIALHRIAFLLYRHKDRLSAKNITILSPNKVFGDYISNVLPELGEEPIFEVGLRDIALVALEGIINFVPDKEPFEVEDMAWAERVQHKSTLAFKKQMESYLEDMPNRIFEPEDCTFGRFIAKAEWIEARYKAYYKHPVKQRLQMIAGDIHNRFETDNVMEEDIPPVKTILKKLNGMLKVKSALALYKEFYKSVGFSQMFVMPEKNTLEWADVFPYMYCQATFAGLQESKMIKYLVIDEMQDYTPVQYAVLNLLFPCPKTILGDFGQFTNPNHLHRFEDMKDLYSEAEFVELNKSYRSTYEIMAFAQKVQSSVKIEPMERHGKAPVIIPCKNWEDEISKIICTIDAFFKAENTSLGIIAKTNSQAKRIFNLLPVEYGAQLISPESAKFSNGVSVTSVQMAKGLEFDEVIIPDVDVATYQTAYDRSLLYIACTRAMHRLSVFYTGKRSGLLAKV